MSARTNRRTALALGGVAVAMTGASFAAVPLYEVFCRVTGFGGTTRRADHAPEAAGTRLVTVRFDASVAGGLPWDFAPAEREVRIPVGEERLIHYRATNRSGMALTGSATFNVTPHKAGPFFQKIACFCFTEQTLSPGQSIEMPVSFFVDPDFATDPNVADVDVITLSYTFFRARGREPARNAAAR